MCSMEATTVINYPPKKEKIIKKSDMRRDHSELERVILEKPLLPTRRTFIKQFMTSEAINFLSVLFSELAFVSPFQPFQLVGAMEKT